MADELRRMSAPDLLRRARAALARGDRTELSAIVRILSCRRTPLAAETEREVQALLRRVGTPEGIDAHRSSRREKCGTAVEVFEDDEIEPQRERMILRARRSIYLSSLTPPSERLARLLLMQALKGLQVVLIIAERTVKTSEQEHRVQRLEKAGVECRYPRSTHSKCLVIDGQEVMNGSANAHRVNRDVCDVWRGRDQARKIINNLNRLR